ncbi:hypothetical protein FHX82_001260 [Amycolatopsis bartoniae]|uniref:DUF5709 domain-containing protein n=1 Tax=Amycolatopsis bartoniae TaxID=941986 RepID=A0A8H9MAI0_9PSEU|nr:hypothetical protein [Amycolatopsis bartoniae]MBB2934240.1 hypothetical protein [Amycolatopsis bartoniae]TVT08446.1 hypothetical protein FNH07_12365 [Amycolatopsis bartoniae]GHF48861.1 hypothetical protein GCM10017566_22720 [Amycolatopsis bartoniae]
MSEAHGHPVPDSVESDPAALNSAEDLDEDRLRVDPLEEGIEPPERYAFSDGFGTTPNEERDGKPLEDRLREERPDVQPEDPDRPTTATTPAEQLDESVDDQVGTPETLVRDDADSPRGVPSVEEDQNADKPGGSVAETFRTPPTAPQ